MPRLFSVEISSKGAAWIFIHSTLQAINCTSDSSSEWRQHVNPYVRISSWATTTTWPFIWLEKCRARPIHRCRIGWAIHHEQREMDVADLFQVNFGMLIFIWCDWRVQTTQLMKTTEFGGKNVPFEVWTGFPSFLPLHHDCTKNRTPNRRPRNSGKKSKYMGVACYQPSAQSAFPSNTERNPHWLDQI